MACSSGSILISESFPLNLISRNLAHLFNKMVKMALRKVNKSL